VDCSVDGVGFETRGHGQESKKEAPATVFNSLMEITRAGGGVGIPGLDVPEDPGGNDANAKRGILGLTIGLAWPKSLSFLMGQALVMKYHRQLMQAILYGKIQPVRRWP
jgi:glutathione-independent formaldehyde dehydrogenase